MEGWSGVQSHLIRTPKATSVLRRGRHVEASFAAEVDTRTSTQSCHRRSRLISTDCRVLILGAKIVADRVPSFLLVQAGIALGFEPTLEIVLQAGSLSLDFSQPSVSFRLKDLQFPFAEPDTREEFSMVRTDE
jgi:hypothetical protein